MLTLPESSQKWKYKDGRIQIQTGCTGTVSHTVAERSGVSGCCRCPHGLELEPQWWTELSSPPSAEPCSWGQYSCRTRRRCSQTGCSLRICWSCWVEGPCQMSLDIWEKTGTGVQSRSLCQCDGSETGFSVMTQRHLKLLTLSKQVGSTDWAVAQEVSGFFRRLKWKRRCCV